MDSARDEYFTHQDQDEYGQWLEELEPQGEELNAYLIALCSYYGNRHEI